MIDSIERSLFAVGVVSNRIDADNDAFVLHPSLLAIVTGLQTKSGLLALVVSGDECGMFKARIEGREVSLDADDPGKAVSAVHQLLHSTGIFIPSERAGL